jgi:hypothetical protein
MKEWAKKLLGRVPEIMEYRIQVVPYFEHKFNDYCNFNTDRGEYYVACYLNGKFVGNLRNLEGKMIQQKTRSGIRKAIARARLRDAKVRSV